MALCTNEILFGFTITGKVPVIVSPYTIFPTSVYNGKSYYTWYDATAGFDFILRWDSADNCWKLGYEDGGFQTIAYLDNAPSDCPFKDLLPFSWIIVEAGWANISTESGNPLVDIPTEDQECFEILVWNKQCEFAQCVLKYLQLLQFGSVPCEALETLKNKLRILKILNCYDTRDIITNTTDHNAFSYQEIKQLLNH